MTEKDEIKEGGLKKLDKAVEFALTYLVDNRLSLESYSLEICDGYFTEEELNEISGSLAQASDKNKVHFYCDCRRIDFPDILL